MTCRSYADRLDVLEDYIQGALTAAAAADVRQHVEACAACRATVDDAMRAGNLLRVAAPAAAPGEFFWTRLGARIREQETALAAGGEFWGSLERFSWRFSFGAAMMATLLLGIVIGTKYPVVSGQAGSESREIFPEPAAQPADQNEVLLELASARNVRNP
jgi:anti-sigma factor RsiW